MSAALTAQPGLHSTATAVSMKAKVNGKNRKRKKSTMVGGACATLAGGACATGEYKGIHGFRFLALWWWLYSGKSSGWVILYSVIRGWALPRFLSGSQVSSAVEYPFHLIRKVRRLGFPLCPRTASTSYSSSPPIRSGGGWRKLGPCSDVSL